MQTLSLTAIHSCDSEQYKPMPRVLKAIGHWEKKATVI